MDMNALNPDVRAVLLLDKAIAQAESRFPEARAVFVLSGDLAIECAGEVTHMRPGAFCYLPPFCSFAAKSKHVRAVVVRFLPEYGKEPVEETRGALFVEDMAGERETFLRMCDIYNSSASDRLPRLSAMLKLLLLGALATEGEGALPAAMAANLDSYIRDNMADDISNTELGAVFGYHPFYVSQMLKKKLGITLKQYVIAYRLRTARALLETTEKTTAEIAELTGFTDASYFTKTFKSSFGKTPKEYRESLKQQNT
jgi:AraC-like DNA-binding protein